MAFDQPDAPQTEIGSSGETRIDLGLKIIDAPDAKDPASCLMTGKEQIRETVFRAAVEQIIPDLVHSTGHSIEPPPGRWRIDSESDSSHQLDAAQVSGGVLTTRHALTMVFRFHSDRIMNQPTILYLAREQVAMAIADQVVHGLEQHYVGKERSTIASQSSLTDGEVSAYSVREDAA